MFSGTCPTRQNNTIGLVESSTNAKECESNKKREDLTSLGSDDSGTHCYQLFFLFITRIL